MAKKLLCILVAVALVLGILPAGSLQAQALTQIMDHQEIYGRSYSLEYADKLDAIFSGSVKLFSNTSATFPLGKSLNNSKVYQIAGVISGYQCYIYAQAVYYYLFGDIPYTGNGLVYWSNSSKIMENQSIASYESFRAANVGFGAYVRTTTNRDGSFNGSGGHSFIILSYDEGGITYLEGNANGYGLVCVTNRTWSEFNANQLGGRNRKISHIVQHNDIVYCSHDDYGSEGDCLKCRHPYDWESSFTFSTAGRYQTLENVVPREDKPYAAAPQAGFTLEAGTMVDVLGSCVNAAGEDWYVVGLNGAYYYIPAEALEYDTTVSLKVSCSGFSPANQAVLEKKSQPVMGAVVSNSPLKTLNAYLDGQLYATWYAENDTTIRVNLRETAINSNLTFASLEEGKHTFALEAYSFAHAEPVTFLQSVFYIVEKPEVATYTVSFNPNGGYDAPDGFFIDSNEEVTLSLQQPVREGYTFLGWATAADAGEVAYRPGDKFTAHADTVLFALWRADRYTLSGTVTSYLTDGEVKLELLANGEVVHTTMVHTMSATYTIDGLPAGKYILRVSKPGHVTREYTLMVGKKLPVQDVNLCPVGDVTGDGLVNAKDYQRMLRHVNKLAPLEGYELACGDVTGDEHCSAKDVQRLLRHINKVQPLF